jgi:hypothetical protein
MRLRARILALLLATSALPASAQQAPAFATGERDSAALFIAQGSFVIGRIAGECLTLVGRAETPETFITAWKQRNARFVAASGKYLDLRLEEAAASGGKERSDLALREMRALVQQSGEAAVRSMLQGRKEDRCMRAITMIDAGALDISTRLPQYEQLEALVRWAEK